jgi:hypothetical protein
VDDALLLFVEDEEEDDDDETAPKLELAIAIDLNIS